MLPIVFAQVHSVFFFQLLFHGQILKCTGLKIGDFGFLYVFIHKSKNICSRETYNTSFESSFHEVFKICIVYFCIINTFWFTDQNVKKISYIFLLFLLYGQILEKHINQSGLKYTHFFVQVCRKGHQLSNLASFELKKSQRSK